MSNKNTPEPSRRNFLKLAGTAAPAAALAVAAGDPAEASTAPAKTGQMQDTAHTRAYFDSARF